jgi:hypothetical protein
MALLLAGATTEPSFQVRLKTTLDQSQPNKKNRLVNLAMAYIHQALQEADSW